MHSGLAFQVAVGIFAFKGNGRALHAHFVAFLVFGYGHFVAVTLAPAHIHSHKHSGPVVGFRTAGSGVDGKHGSEVVALCAKHIAQLQVLNCTYRGCIGCVQFLGFFSFHEFQKHIQVINQRCSLVEGGYRLLYRAGLLEEGFGCLRVVPEAGLLTFGFIVSDFLALGFYSCTLPESLDSPVQFLYLLLCCHNRTKLGILP